VAVSFSANGQSFTCVLSGGAQSARTQCAFLKVGTNRAVYTGVLGMFSLSTDYTSLALATGANIELDDSSSSTTPIVLTVGAWYFVAISTSGVNNTVYTRLLSSGVVTTQTNATGDSSVTCTNLVIGDSVFAGDWLSGSMSGVRVWYAQLSTAELARESRSLLPSRTANLAAAYPLGSPTDTADYSGAGLTLSGGAGAGLDTSLGIPMTADVCRGPQPEAVNRSCNW
jgi:hypothetical protein